MEKPSSAVGLDSSSTEWIISEVRVRYAETDQMGVVYYANYLVWFEVGRAEYCRQRGLPYRDFERKTGVSLAVAECQCRYHSPALYDEVLTIRTRIQTVRKRTVTFEYEVSKKDSGVSVASGYTTHVVIDKSGKPRSFPAEYLKFFK